MAKVDLKKIKLLVLDVDGVLTDGKIFLTPRGEEIKVFNVRDGAGMKYWKRSGGKLAIISGRGSDVVFRRAKELDVDLVRLNVKDKRSALAEVMESTGLTAEQTACMGDDLPDLPLLNICGFAGAPGDAVQAVREAADHVTQLGGGKGCVREFIEHLLTETGQWEGVMKFYRPSGVELSEKER
ncbi:MAG: KdsC family phosphatase [Phycisphaerae bacterium]